MTNTTPDATIGDRIRRFRGKSMTQQQLATAAEVSVDLIRKLEQNRFQTRHLRARQYHMDGRWLSRRGRRRVAQASAAGRTGSADARYPDA